MGVGMGWMWLFWLLLIAGLVLLIVVAARALGGRSPEGEAPPDGGRARQVLDERYASGEIDTEEYRERLRELGEGPR